MNKMVCFDIGNVLVKLGKSTKEIFDIEDEKELAIVLKKISLGEIDCFDFLKKIKFLSKNKHLTINEIEKLFISHRIEKINDGVLDLIEELVSKNIKLSIMSNTNDLHWSFIKRKLPVNDFDEIVLSHICKVEKPNIEIYRILEGKTGFKSQEIIFFDDMEENIITAYNLGWNANLVKVDKPVEFIRMKLNENKLL